MGMSFYGQAEDAASIDVIHRALNLGINTAAIESRDLIEAVLENMRQNLEPLKYSLLARPRDVRLTLDARLQVRVAALLERHAAAAGRAAAVVIDPDTGDLLASASYPWPSRPAARIGSADGAALLDRARYGLYPPGSTFKLVTAAAALLKDSSAASRSTFACVRLDEGRVGARVRGWGRPVRNDVLDTHPHGSVNLQRGLVVSCNAYFAQLAVSLGYEVMRDAADRAGVSLTPGNAPNRIRETLPHVGYGQGDVLASPLRMARIAGAMAGGGTLRDTRLVLSDRVPAGRELLPAAAAGQLASFMRDAVLTGTGRRLRGDPTPIAGKTGTAEVAGSASHAWFVGFAPYGPATKRVALAVIVENAGYGGAVAAPIAGEIVAAAAALGLAR